MDLSERQRAVVVVTADPTLDHLAARLYACLAMQAAGGVVSTPPSARVAAALGCSERHLRRALGELRARGLVERLAAGRAGARYRLPALARPGGMAAADVRAEIAEALAELEELLAEARRRRPGARPAEEA